MDKNKSLDKGKVLDWLDILIKKENHRLAVENSLTTIGIIKNKIKQGAFDIKGDVLET